MKKKIKAVIRIVALAVIALVLGLGIYEINATRLGGNAVPMPFGVGASVVLSGSMEPELSVGDLLIIAEQEAYEVNDVVVFQEGRASVVHRIIRMEGDTVITMGDANSGEDEPMDVSLIKGKVVFAVPLVGYAVNVIKTPLGVLIVLGLAIFLMERSFAKEKQQENDQLRQIREEIEKLKREQEQK